MILDFYIFVVIVIPWVVFNSQILLYLDGIWMEEISFVFRFSGHNLGCMPWIFPVASYQINRGFNKKKTVLV